MQQILDNRSQPDARAVWQDAEEERGATCAWLMRVAQRNAATAADDADDDAAATTAAAAAADDDDADADDAATADDDADAAATTAADAAADAADAATADDDADADDAVIKRLNRHWRGEDMREGLLLLQIPGRYWGVTRVGYARRVQGDEWEFVGVTVTRTGAVRTLADLAANGPKGDHSVSEVDSAPELLHRFTPRRVLVANEKAWGTHVKKPEGWP